jgi:hypothetical protein
MSNNRVPPGDWAFLSSVNVKISPDPRRYEKLPDDVCVPAAFRAEFNAWCEQFFSTVPERSVVTDGTVYSIGSTLVMNPRTFAQLKEAMKS